MIADNFPSLDYEFNTSSPERFYDCTKGTKRQKDCDIYRNELVSKLIFCPHCTTIVAVYNEEWHPSLLTYTRTYQFVPRNHRCTVAWWETRLKRGERYHCVHLPTNKLLAYPYPLWKQSHHGCNSIWDTLIIYFFMYPYHNFVLIFIINIQLCFILVNILHYL